MRTLDSIYEQMQTVVVCGKEKPMKFSFCRDGHIELTNGSTFILLPVEISAQLIEQCVEQYAKRAVIDRLKLLEDADKEYPCFEGMSVAEIQADESLIDNIAAGLVGAWDIDLQEPEHLDDEIGFWIKERS